MRNAWAFDETPLDSLVCSGNPRERMGPSLSLALNQISCAWPRNYWTYLEVEALSVRDSPQPLSWLVITFPFRNEALVV